MSESERRRMLVLSMVKEKRLSLEAAARSLELSYRQTKRIWRRYQTEGDAGLVHAGRGRSSNRSHPESFRRGVIARYKERYEGFGPTLAAEKLEADGFTLDHDTLRRWLLEEGVIKRRRKSRVHRQRRERRGRFGELVQFDGSHHDWFEGRREKCCLMNMVDDATGATMSLFSEEETTEAAMRVLWAWIVRYGIPEALYLDRHAVYECTKGATIDEELAGEAPLTAFGRACKKLGIRLITAYSPQAKGRVERSNGTYQDRLVKEMRLLCTTTIEEGNKLLMGGFTDDLNRKFAVAAVDECDAHVSPGAADLATIFVFEDTRVVSNDLTVRHKNRVYQLTKQKDLPNPRRRVVVSTRLCGALHILWQGRDLAYVEVAPPQKKSLPMEPRVLSLRETADTVTDATKARTPARNHPWRGGDYRPKTATG